MKWRVISVVSTGEGGDDDSMLILEAAEQVPG